MHAQETAPAVTSPCDQRPAPAARNPLWIFDNLKHVVVIAGELVMVLDDVQPALVGEADGDAVLGGGDFHGTRTSVPSRCIIVRRARQGNVRPMRRVLCYNA